MRDIRGVLRRVEVTHGAHNGRVQVVSRVRKVEGRFFFVGLQLEMGDGQTLTLAFYVHTDGEDIFWVTAVLGGDPQIAYMFPIGMEVDGEDRNLGAVGQWCNMYYVLNILEYKAVYSTVLDVHPTRRALEMLILYFGYLFPYVFFSGRLARPPRWKWMSPTLCVCCSWGRNATKSTDNGQG